jgi:hypothetical protein
MHLFFKRNTKILETALYFGILYRRHFGNNMRVQSGNGDLQLSAAAGFEMV